MRKIIMSAVIALSPLTNTFGHFGFFIKKAEYAVYVSIEQAKQSAESQIWQEALEACGEQSMAILQEPIKYKISVSEGNTQVVGTGEFKCGF